MKWLVVNLTLIVLGEGGGGVPQLSRSSITQSMHLDATLKYLYKLKFFPLLVYPFEFGKNIGQFRRRKKNYKKHLGRGGGVIVLITRRLQRKKTLTKED